MTVSGQGDQTVAVISFYSAGEKEILLCWAPLEAISLSNPSSGLDDQTHSTDERESEGWNQYDDGQEYEPF